MQPLASHDITNDSPNHHIIFSSLFLHFIPSVTLCARHRAMYWPFVVSLDYHNNLLRLMLIFLLADERSETQQNKDVAAVLSTQLHNCGFNLVICVISSFVPMTLWTWLNKGLMDLIYSDSLQTSTPLHLIFVTMLRAISSLSSLNHNVKIFFF